ncbi:TonB-dependent receptor [Sphingobacterium sp.]|uniref:TonB-dependent receptor n=1 Tax=Sphingobacterium sp. TaxID=341027 RepID=UPI0025860D27|nr:TonB-dependent receptor [Sphingobacterium sp.]WET67039.1 MAG: TonB-dependent receptor [Sphingobacterium sp.]
MQKVVKLLRSTRFIKYLLPKGALLLLFLILFNSKSVYGQDLLNSKINVELKDVSLKVALNELQKQSAVRFIFDQDIKKYDALKIKQNFKDITLKKVLILLLKNTNLQAIPEGGHVMILERPSVKSSINPKEVGDGSGQGSGTLKGRIVEFETSQPLPGASVTIVEINKAVSADNNGYYRFAGLKTGRYTLRVSFISYKTESQLIEVRANKDITYDIKLQGNNQLSEVVVTAAGKLRRPVGHTNDKQVLMEVKNAQSVVSGISSQQISMSADRNAAEVVQKISGVTIKDDKFIIIRGMNERYNLTYLNGNIAPSTELYSRAFSLDLLPSRIIDRILVYKSPAPDLMADMTGGAVKIFTKDAVNVKHFDMELQLGYRTGTTFNKNFLISQGSATDFLGFDNGMRNLPSSLPGYGDFTKASISQQEYVKTFTSYLEYGKKNALPMGQMTMNYYNSVKLGSRKVSTLTSLSYKSERQHNPLQRLSSFYNGNKQRTHSVIDENQSTESNQINLLQNLTLKLNDNNRIAFKNYVLVQGQQATILRDSRDNQYYVVDDSTSKQGYWRDANSGQVRNRNIILSYSQRMLYSGSFNGEHKFSEKQQLNWMAGYTYSKLQLPDQRVIRLQKNREEYDNLTPGPPDYTWIAAIRPKPGVENLDNGLERGMISRTWTRNIEHLYNGSLDYVFNVTPLVTFRAGTYQQWKARTLFRRVYTLNEGDLNSNGFPDVQNIGGNGRFIDLDKVLWREQDLGRLWSDNYIRDDGSGLKVFDRTSGSDAYMATEQLNAGYIALGITPFDKRMEIYGGVRLEYDRQKVAAAIPPDVNSIGGLNIPVLVDNKNTDILPSINISYRPTDFLTTRVAYGKTVNRPEFRELSPYAELDYLNNQSVQGNNKLVSASIHNVDARIELYPHNDTFAETFSLGIFYKQIDKPIERMVSRDLLLGGPAHISYSNADKASVKGVELDLRKSLSFIPLDVMRNISIIGNLTLIKSKAEKSLDTLGVNKNTDPYLNPHFKRKLQGQAPYSANLGLYYENAGSGTKVAAIWNIVGPRIYAAANGQPFKLPDENSNLPTVGNQGSLLELKRQTLDLSITQRFRKSWQLKLSGQNVLDQSIKMAEDENFTYTYEKASFEMPRDLKNVVKPYKYTITGDLLASEYKPGRHFILSLLYSF